MIYIIGFIIAGLSVAVLYYNHQKVVNFRKIKSEFKKMAPIKNYIFDSPMGGFDVGGIGFIEESDQFIHLIQDIKSPHKFSIGSIPANKIIGVEIIEDGQKITETSTASAVSRAVIGGLASGGIGAVIGGVTGKQVHSEVSSKLALEIKLNDLSTPSVTILFFKSADKIKKDSSTYAAIVREAKDWVNLINVITHRKNEKTGA